MYIEAAYTCRKITIFSWCYAREYKSILQLPSSYIQHYHTWSVSIMRNYSILFFIVSRKKDDFVRSHLFAITWSVQNQCAAIDDEDVKKGYNFSLYPHVFSCTGCIHIDTKKGLSSLLFIITGISRFSIFYINHFMMHIMQLIISNAECARFVQYWYGMHRRKE